MYFCLWIIAVLSEDIQAYLLIARYFYFLCKPIILVSHAFVFNWKASLENV